MSDSHRTHWPLRNRGFTLLETLTALVVVGVLTSLAAPSLAGQIARIRSESILNALVGDLYYARMMAVRSGNRVEVRFALPPGSACAVSYDLVELGDSARTVKRVAINGAAKAVCLDPGNSGSPLVYNSRGLPFGLGTRTMTVTSGKISVGATQSRSGRLHRVY